MPLNNIKNSGFTIVELLIVIVVIAILATISTVAYSGIQSRAKTTMAQANASQVQRIADSYYADNSVYPTTTAMFRAGAVKLPSSVIILTNASASTIPTLDASNGENSILYRYVTGGTGACIFYYDFTSGAVISGTSIMYTGNATSSNCSGTTGATGNTPTS